MSPRATRLRLEQLESIDAPATFTVTNSADTGTGTFRQAILNANATPGADVIAFRIGSVGSEQRVFVGSTLTDQLPTITDAVTIDGRSQGVPGYTGAPLISLVPTRGYAISDGLTTTASNTTIVGLKVQAFRGDGLVVAGGRDVQIYGNEFVGNGGSGVEVGAAASSVRVGKYTKEAGSPFPGNLIAGNLIAGNRGPGVVVGGNGNFLYGNRIGTTRDGTAASANGPTNVLVTGQSNVVGDWGAAGNVVSGSSDAQIRIAGAGAVNNRVMNNYVGLNAAGTGAILDVPSGGSGIVLDAGSNNTLVYENMVSGNMNGLWIKSANNGVYSNRIGTEATGTALPTGTTKGNWRGVLIDGPGATGNQIGDGHDGDNVIAGNFYDMEVYANGNAILGNRFGVGLTGTVLAAPTAYSVFVTGNNNAIGGTLAGQGNTFVGDPANTAWGVGFHQDSVGNRTLGNTFSGFKEAISWPTGYGGVDYARQAAPTLKTVTTSAAGTTVTGGVTGTAGTVVRVELFAGTGPNSPAAVYLGSVTVTIGANGRADFTALLPAVTGYSVLTATATGPGGNTSRFSNALAV